MEKYVEIYLGKTGKIMRISSWNFVSREKWELCKFMRECIPETNNLSSTMTRLFGIDFAVACSTQWKTIFA